MMGFWFIANLNFIDLTQLKITWLIMRHLRNWRKHCCALFALMYTRVLWTWGNACINSVLSVLKTIIEYIRRNAQPVERQLVRADNCVGTSKSSWSSNPWSLKQINSMRSNTAFVSSDWQRNWAQRRMRIQIRWLWYIRSKRHTDKLISKRNEQGNCNNSRNKPLKNKEGNKNWKKLMQRSR